MDKEQTIRLTSAELAQLWTSYMNNSMSICVLTYFREKAKDTEIKSLIDFALDVSNTMLQSIKEIYIKENHAIPVGFNEKEDVNLHAPALYSDVLFANYVHSTSRHGLSAYGAALSGSSRSDIVDLFSNAIDLTKQLYKRSLNLLHHKGLYYRSSAIPVPDHVDFVEKQGYLTGWFGERRPMNALEIMHFYVNMQRNSIGKALLLGFAQTAGLQEVRNYMVRGANIANKVVEFMSTILSKENISDIPTFDSEVLKSTTPPFSDKLMMFQVSMLSGMSLGYYGIALGTISRRDLGSKFIRISLEALQYAEDGANIMIDHGWMEQPPASFDHLKIAKTKKK